MRSIRRPSSGRPGARAATGGPAWLVVLKRVVLILATAVLASTGQATGATGRPADLEPILAASGRSAAAGTGAGALPGGTAPVVGVPPLATSPRNPWSWPLSPTPAVVRPFDPPKQTWSAGHRGVDLAAVLGQAVLSPAAGVVTFDGVIVGRGVLVVTHPGGLRSTFEPVAQGLPVGTMVLQGAPVAVVAPNPGHCAPSSCLHWGVLRGETYLDPLAFVGPRRVILLPLEPP